MAPGEARWDVFLAHAGPDADRAQVLYDALTALGLRVFLDKRSLLPGDDWPTEIHRALRTSDVVVVLVSAVTEGAHYAGEEIVISISETRAGRQRLVPIHIEPNVEDPYGTARKNRIDWYDEAEVAVVVSELRRVIPRAMRGEATGAATFCTRIPVPPRHFTGRDDLLARLAAGMGRGRTTTLTQTIQGMGGVGKTTVAAALCEAQREHHDIVWWVRAEDQGTLVADLAELADPLGVTTPQGGDEDARAVVRELQTTERRWLVVYDNVPDRDSVHPWLPKRGTGAAILTSRYKHMDDLGDVEPVDILPDPVAKAFLRERVAKRNPAAAEEDLDAVLGRVQGLPLALEQAAAWVERKPNRRFAAWVELYDEAAETAFAQTLADYEHTAFSAWRVSIDAATQESPSAEPMLGALGHFAPEGIAISWLRDAAEDPYLDTTPDGVDAAIDALDTYDLVTITADDTIDIHRVVHDVARRTAPDAAGPFAVRAITAQDPGGYEHQAWARLSALAPHARAVVRGPQVEDTAQQQALVTLLARIGWVAKDEGQLGIAVDLADAAFSTGRDTVPHSEASLIASAVLASVHQAMGDVDRAIALFETVYADSERAHGPEAQHTLAGRNNLAGALLEAGDLPRATTLYEDNLAIRERILGPDHPDTFISRNNLAHAYQSAGDHTRAIPLHEQNLADQERIFGPDHPSPLTSRNNLAAAYRGAGDLTRATPLYEDNLAARERILGPITPTPSSAATTSRSPTSMQGPSSEPFPSWNRWWPNG